MKLIKYDNFWNDPFAEFDLKMRDLFGDRFSLPSFFANEFGEDFARSFRVDSFVTDQGYQIVAELPGIPKEAIDVKLENALLTVSGEHKTGEGDNQKSVRFSRTITVGDGIDVDNVQASLRNGLLTIDLPKKEERRPKAITVS